jgi:hypothetical protein
MRESRPYGSVRGARGNSRPYREGRFFATLHESGCGTELPNGNARDYGRCRRVSGLRPESFFLKVGISAAPDANLLPQLPRASRTTAFQERSY